MKRACSDSVNGVTRRSIQSSLPLAASMISPSRQDTTSFTPRGRCDGNHLRCCLLESLSNPSRMSSSSRSFRCAHAPAIANHWGSCSSCFSGSFSDSNFSPVISAISCITRTAIRPGSAASAPQPRWCRIKASLGF